jgi:enoyl-CoA hydratase/carnithine racemase
VFVKSELLDGVLVLSLTRPEKLNALTLPGLQELERALESARADSIRVVVLRGAGRSFCAGADVAAELGTESLSRLDAFLTCLASTLRRVSLLPKPVIAAVQGHAAGGGAELALEADLRIAADDAELWFPDVAIGSTPASVYQLVRHVGSARATSMVLLQQRLTAAEMLRFGMLVEVVPASDLDSAALQLARRIASHPASSLRFAKEAVRLASEATREADLAANVAAMLACHAS